MQTQHYGLEQTRIHLPAILSRAHAGSTSVITRHGKPYAAIVPLTHLKNAAHSTGFLALRGTGKGLWGGSPSQTIDALRNEWD
jgi:antitoxin (DNA-binding transcriptional repressor) of toxin-antitoxin stability system